MILAYQNCGKNNPGNEPAAGMPQTPINIQVTGTLHQVNLDGCNFLIEAHDNQTGQIVQFNPVKLDPSFKKDGCQISVMGSLRTDMVSTCLSGQILQISEAHLINCQAQ